MKSKTLITGLLLITTLTLSGFIKANDIQRKTSFNSNWRFQKGCIANAEEPAFDDSKWRILSLPHDWSVEPLNKEEYPDAVGPFSRKSPGSFNTGQTIGGEGWYRKSFTIRKEDAGKRHILYFEGSYNQTEVWVNGQKAGYNVYGYTSFRCDITKYCLPAGQKNQIAVRVVNEGVNSRWYSGSGLYRHVWMLTTGDVHLDEWETAIRTTRLTEKSAELSISTTIINEGKQASLLAATVEILAPDGKRVFFKTTGVSNHNMDSAKQSFQVQIATPKAWSVEAPVLYTARITLSDGKKKIDQISVPFGIRTLEFSAQKGFLLNGKPGD